MIQRVYEQAVQAAALNTVVVATDDVRIEEHVCSWGGHVVMTDPHHHSGTDRCAEVVRTHFPDADLIVNIQGDEPFIHPEQIDLLVRIMGEYPSADMATLAKKIEDPALLDNPNVVKVVFSEQNARVLYFSRHPIPYARGVSPESRLAHYVWYKHIGLYAYRKKALLEVALCTPTALERAESLEQLRWLEHGYCMVAGITDRETIGIDTPEDLALISL